MKVINLLFLLLIIFSCSCKDDIEGEKIYSGDPYVRFNLILDSNNDPIYDGDEVSSSTSATETYTNNSLITTKIPVALTYTGLDKEIQVNYSVTNSGYNDYEVSPSVLSFNEDQLTDTLYVQWNSSWDESDNAQLDFELTDVSDESISIGNLNNSLSNSLLTVTLGEPEERTVNFSESQISISGEEGEEVYFSVEFPGGYLPDDIEGKQIIDTISADFNFDLELVDEKSDRSAFTYKLTVLDDLTSEEAEFAVKLGFADDLDLEAEGQTTLEIVKDETLDRDTSANIAAQFYNVSNQYYQTQFYFWVSSNDECTWYRAKCFVDPVVVDEDDENAVYNESTGEYYDAFKIQFRSITSKVINVLAMKKWFSSGLSTSIEDSPGMDQIDLEFIPADGNNLKEGEVFIKNKEYVIGSKSGNSYAIRMSAEGTYTAVSENNGTDDNPEYDYDVQFELTISAPEIFGEDSVKAYYYLTNYSRSKSSYTDNSGQTVSSYWPIPDEPCFDPVELE